MDAHKTQGSNIFSDIGLSRANQDKYELAFTVSKMIYDSGLSQRDVAERSGWTQAKVSALINGRLDGISIGKIIEVAQALGYRVVVSFRAPDESATETTRPEQVEESNLATV